MRSSCLFATVGLVSALAACSDDPVYWPYGADTGVGDTTSGDTSADAATDASTDTAPARCTVEDDPVCGDYLCDVASGECFSSCVFGDECADGRACDIVDMEEGGECVSPGGADFIYLAIVSTADGSDALDNQNPGPDIDAITVMRGGVESAPIELTTFRDGQTGEDANARPLSTHWNALFERDTVVGGVCDLDAQPGYVSLGGSTGFVAMQMPFALEAGDQIIVYEVDSNYCSDAAVERPDTYEVYATDGVFGPNTPDTADDIRQLWCFVGASGGTGGVLEVAFTCGM